MKDLNPNDSKAISRNKSWNSTTVDERLGFVNRDALVSENIASPMVMYPMGRMLNKPMAAEVQEPTYGMDMVPGSLDHYPTWVPESANVAQLQSKLTSPGIMVLHFDPIFGAGTEDTKAGMKRIFTRRWIALRFAQSMTEHFQSGDLQFMHAAIMNLDMHIENARRALKLLKIGTRNSQNKFADIQDLLAACGWPMEYSDVDKNLNEWIDQFNRIIGNLNSIKFFHDLCPGEKRWSSLVKEIYKDTSADTRYTQTYLLTPKHYFRPRQIQYQPTPGDAPVPVWALSVNASDASYPCFAWEFSSVKGQAATTLGPIMFQRYLDRIEEDVDTIFYDSGLIDILATMRAAPDKLGLDFSEFSYEFEDKDTTDKTEYPYTWDLRMMLAIHNATIVDSTFSAMPTQSASDGYGTYVDPATSYFITNIVPTPQQANSYMPFMSKLCNMPNFNASNADFANATQWTIACDPNVDPTDKLFGGENWGTDIITDAHYYAYSNVDGNGNYYPNGDCLRCYKFYQNVIDSPTTTTPDYPAGYTWNTSRDSDFASTAFCLAPLRYHISEYTTPDMQSGEIGRMVTNVTGDTDVLHRVTHSLLVEWHKTFVNNFWGYPTSVPVEGTPDFNFTEGK